MSKADRAHFNRRQTLGLIAGLPLLAAGTRAQANSDITFDELYGKVSVLGLEFSEKVKQLNGKEIAMRGFMAPPLKAEAQFFVLTEIPMSICPFCSTDADWPDNIVVVYLGEKQTLPSRARQSKCAARWKRVPGPIRIPASSACCAFARQNTRRFETMLPLKIDDLAVSFPGLSAPVLVLDGLEIAAGSRVALTGGSGSGKAP